jgi:hypothetical protein
LAVFVADGRTTGGYTEVKTFLDLPIFPLRFHLHNAAGLGSGIEVIRNSWSL